MDQPFYPCFATESFLPFINIPEYINSNRCPVCPLHLSQLYDTRASDLVHSNEACAINHSIIVCVSTGAANTQPCTSADRAFAQLGFEELGKGKVSCDLWPFQPFVYSHGLLGAILDMIHCLMRKGSNMQCCPHISNVSFIMPIPNRLSN